jgi:DnaJ-class molecular chaperone
MAYQILQDETLRREYDETGVIPDTNDNDGDAGDMSGSNAWKSYFDQIFGKVTTSKIDSFAATYKVGTMFYHTIFAILEALLDFHYVHSLSLFLFFLVLCM